MSKETKPWMELQDIKKKEIKLLVKEGIETPEELEYSDVRSLSKATGIGKEKLSKWQATVRLRRVPGIGQKLSHLLANKDVREPWELLDSSPEKISRNKHEEKKIKQAQNVIAHNLSEDAISILLTNRPEDIQKLLAEMKPKTYRRIQQISIALTQGKTMLPHLQVLKKHVFKDLDIDKTTPNKIKKRLQSMSIEEISELQRELKNIKSEEGVHFNE